MRRGTKGPAAEGKGLASLGLWVSQIVPSTVRRLRTPAPGLPALSVKFGLALDHHGRGLTGSEACIAALSRDTQALARRSS